MSLIKVADLTKKILLVVLALLVVLLIAKIVVTISEKLTETLTTRYSAETRGFGDLPPLTLKTISGADKHNPTFELETLTGELPAVGNLFNVYRINQPVLDLSSETAAQELAEDLEFISQPKKLSTVDWTWAELDKTLDVDIQTKHFTYKNLSPEIEDDEPSENPESILPSLLSRMGYDLPESAECEVEYLTAPWVQISMYYTLPYRGEEEARVSSTNYIPTTTYAVVPNSDSVSIENVKELSYYHWEVETENVQTYYTISVENAYDTLNQGNGVLVYAAYAHKSGTPSVADISTVWISDVKPGYYTAKSNLLYQQPIYIFYGFAGEGQNRVDLVYYIPAI